jgi:HlyD family secretion protein
MKRPRRALVAAALGSALLAAGLVAFVMMRPIRVVVAAPQENVAVGVYGLGTVEARILSRIGFDVAGTLVRLEADQGDRVRAGTPLAALDDSAQQAIVAQTAASVVQARASLLEARAKLARADAMLTQSRRTNQRKQALVERGNVSEQVAEDAEAALAVAEADRAQALAALEVAAGNLQQAEATALRERTVLAQHRLRAPFDAVVIARQRELGAPMRAGEALFTLIDPESVWVLAYVEEASAGGLAVGQKAEIRLRSLPGRSLRGRIARIERESDRVSEERRVNVAFDDPPRELFLGEQAEVVITKAELQEALLVPRTAALEFDGSNGKVWTVEDGRLRQRAVSFSQRTLDGKLVLESGLPPGVQVVTELQPGLRPDRPAIASAEAAP